MFIPEYCPKEALNYFKRDITSTAESFKSWDTCMDNKTCKIVAIVGIVLAALVVLWICTSVLRCLCFGFESCAKLFCCCFWCRDNQSREAPMAQTAYSNPHMYPQQGYQPNQLYYGRGVVSDEDEKVNQYDTTRAYRY